MGTLGIPGERPHLPFIDTKKESVMKKETIAFDMDGTICEHIRRNHPEDILKVKPLICSFNNDLLWIDLIKDLKKKGYKILIFTRRGILKKGRELTEQWLKNYKVPYDELRTEKPHYDLLIDDRAQSTFQGYWSPETVINQMDFSIHMTKQNMYKKYD